MLKFEQNFPLSQITTLQIGGPARQFVTVYSQEELIEAITYARKNSLPYLVIGGGSNLLVADAGVNKLVIKNEIEGITKLVRFLKVKSGTPLQHLVDYSIAQNLSGLQKLTDIPGSLGGAVYGAAGAYGQTISDYIREVICFDGEKIISLQNDECEFEYRDSIFKRNEFIILEVIFKLEVGEVKKLRKEADEILEKRLVKYPKGIKCPGSFFKNLVAEKLPKEILSRIPKEMIVYGKLPAGSLLEEVGAKGEKLGQIEIADYHANLFINKGDGKASDFYTLAKKYAVKVKEKFGITLEPEVQLINLPPIF
ncbi:MAG: UDP-N-acetylenolpyruvoylglucosamine reductase [Microgenomates group bacterium Gr01-1014_7]|nr:MAG: UDP-N-acetylenolpyruvoylglucosamine reductase [Microgenomates group bacterium Gr01-1014_7]